MKSMKGVKSVKSMKSVKVSFVFRFVIVGQFYTVRGKHLIHFFFVVQPVQAFRATDFFALVIGPLKMSDKI